MSLLLSCCWLVATGRCDNKAVLWTARTLFLKMLSSANRKPTGWNKSSFVWKVPSCIYTPHIEIFLPVPVQSWEWGITTSALIRGLCRCITGLVSPHTNLLVHMGDAFLCKGVHMEGFHASHKVSIVSKLSHLYTSGQPIWKKDITEKGQNGATNLIKGLEQLPYKVRHFNLEKKWREIIDVY